MVSSGRTTSSVPPSGRTTTDPTELPAWASTRRTIIYLIIGLICGGIFFYQITREEQDRFAVASQNKAEAARKTGRFRDEIVPVTVTERKGVKTVSDDESKAARSAHRNGPFPVRCDAPRQVGWQFCFRPTDSAAKRVLFSFFAACAKVCTRSKRANLRNYFYGRFQIVNPGYLRFTRSRKKSQ